MQEETVLTYCAYCKKQTPHNVVKKGGSTDAGQDDLRCTKCGSARLHKIQGFDAELM